MSLSIIIPVHNTEQYLDECLDSVLSEINTDDEIILNEITEKAALICYVRMIHKYHKKTDIDEAEKKKISNYMQKISSLLNKYDSLEF